MADARVILRAVKNTILSPIYGLYERRLFGSVIDQKMPNHIGFILDGNRRYASAIGLHKGMAHSKGADKTEEILDWCFETKIRIISLYAFSTENFNRQKEEVDSIMTLAENKFISIIESDKIHKNEVKIKAIGDLSMLPKRVIAAIRRAEDNTESYRNYQINICIAYGSLSEIVHAIRSIAYEVDAGKLEPGSIDIQTLRSHLSTGNIPDLDVVIRTGGESRLSNFLLLQSAYAELFFTDIYLPEFRKLDFLRIIRDYQKRKRRYGR